MTYCYRCLLSRIDECGIIAVSCTSANIFLATEVCVVLVITRLEMADSPPYGLFIFFEIL